MGLASIGVGALSISRGEEEGPWDLERLTAGALARVRSWGPAGE